MTLNKALEAHVIKIAGANQITITIKPFASARAYRASRHMVIRPIRGRTTYFVALHEIGHICGKNPRRRLEQEVTAWRWALDNAIVDPTPGVWKHIARALETYVTRAERRKDMLLPSEDHDFWRLLEGARNYG